MTTKIPSGWYYCLRSSELKPGKTLAKRFFNKNLLFWRSQSGKINACDDICPHLGSRLSKLASVNGENIKCFSHKFTFAQKGNCIATGFGTIPSKCKQVLKHYELQEKANCVLFWHDHNNKKPAWNIPSSVLPESIEKNYVRSQFVFNIAIEILNEDNFDVGHLYSWHKVRKVKTTPVKINGPRISVAHNFERHSILFEKPLPSIFNLINKSITSRYSSTLYGHGLTMSYIDIFNFDFKLQDIIWVTPISATKILYTTFVTQIHNPRINTFLNKLKHVLLDPLIFRASIWRLRQEHKLEGHGYWENQSQISDPILTPQEQLLIGPYRKWCKQFI